MGDHDLSPERIAVIDTMKAMGWTAERKRQGKSVIWKFSRPDTNGLFDVVSVNHKALSWGWLIWRGAHEDGLREAMDRAARLWLRDNYPRHATLVQQ